MIVESKIFEAEGRTVEEAIAGALERAKCERDEAEIEVIEEAHKGLFGLLGSKNARVRLILRPDQEEVLRGFLGRMLDFAGLQDVSVDILETDEALAVELKRDNLAVLIGRHGQTLDSLQYLCNLVSKQGRGKTKPVHLDIDGYRRRRCEALGQLAERMAEKARSLGKPVVLNAMSAQERRIVHVALQDRTDVFTESTGQEPFRKVVIKPVSK